DAVKEIDLAVNLETLFPERFSKLGISFDADLAFSATLGLNLDISATLSREDFQLMVREAGVAVQAEEKIHGMGVVVDALPGSSFGVSEGRFDFDSRVELVFHGLDPPTGEPSGSLYLELPVVSGNASQPTFYINIQSNNVFDPASLDLAAHLILAPEDPNQTIGIGTSSSGDFLLDQATLDLMSGFDTVTIGQPEGSHVVEIGNPEEPTYLNHSWIVSTPNEGGEVHINSDLSVDGNLTIVGSGHTTTIGDGNMNTVPPGNVVGAPNTTLEGTITRVSAAGNITINDSVVLSGDVIIESTGGNISITGTVSSGAEGPYSLTLKAPNGTITIGDEIGDDADPFTGIEDISVTANGDITINDSVVLSGDVIIESTGGNISITGTVSSGAEGPYSLTLKAPNGTITIGDEIGDDAAPFTGIEDISVTANSVVFNSNVYAKGEVSVVVKTGDFNINNDFCSSGSRTITVQAVQGDIVQTAGIIGSIVESKGTVQLWSGRKISQTAVSGIKAASLKIIALGVDGGQAVELNSNNNEVDKLAIHVAVSGAPNYTVRFRNSAQLEIGTVPSEGSYGIEFSERSGIITSGGNAAITLSTVDGTILLNSPVKAAGNGNINITADYVPGPPEVGQGRNIVINSDVQSGTGQITFTANGFITRDPAAYIHTNYAGPGQGIGSNAGNNLSNDLEIDLSTIFDWTAQGPDNSQNGQVIGLDPQGNAVSAAIQSIFVHPVNPNIVYIGTVNGGLWRTTDINNTILVEPYSSAKAEAPDEPTLNATAAGGSLTTGREYRYKVVFVDGTDAESNASDYFGIEIAAPNRTVTLNIPRGPAGTASRRIYRTAALDPDNPGNPTYHLIHTIADNTTLTWTDDGTAVAAAHAREIAIPFPIWEPLTDNYPSLAVGALAFDPDDPNIFYVGTGSRSASNKGGPSIGILKTTDGGKSFTLIGEDEFGGLKVRDIIAGNFAVNTGFAQYDSLNRRLTLFFHEGETTAQQLVNAVNALVNAPVRASIFQAANNGSGIYAAGIYEDVTSGGGAASYAEGAIFPSSENTAIKFRANNTGAQYNNLVVRFVSGAVAANAVTGVYDNINNILTVTIRTGDGGSTADNIIAALNADVNVPFTLSRCVNSGLGTFERSSLKGFTSGGTGTDKASVLFNPQQANTAIVFTSNERGALHNGIEVVFRYEINQITVATEQDGTRGGLYISDDGGECWRLLSGTASGADIGEDTDKSSSVAVGDVNSDGYLDIVIGNTGILTGTRNRLYLNNGTTDPFLGVESIDIDTDGNKTSSIALGDFNEDGLLDVMAGNYGSSNKLYIQNANGTFQAARPIANETRNTTSIVGGDFNKDGHLDVVSGNSGKVNQIYFGDGTGNFSAASDIGTSTYTTTSVAAGDIDKDGDLDLIFGNDGNVNQFFRNNGDGTFQPAVSVTADASATTALALGDVNGDGNIDLCVGNKGQANKVYLGDGTGNFAAGTNIGTQTDNTTSLALGDVNGDHRPDVVVGNSNTTNKLYLNSGSALHPFAGAEAHEISVDKYNTAAVALADLSGENHNQLDLVTANTGTVFGKINRFYKDFSATLPRGTVTDLLRVTTPGPAPETYYFAAVVGGKGAFLDANTIDESEQDRLRVRLGSLDPKQWKALEPENAADRAKFYLTVGNTRQLVTPDFSSVSSMSDVKTAFQKAVDAAFGSGVLKVTLVDDLLTFEIPAGKPFARIERLEDPDAGDTLLGPLTPGVYRSSDHGTTWRQMTGPALRDMSYFRGTGRIEMDAYIPAAGLPTLYVATLHGVRSVDQEAYGGQLEGIWRSDDLGGHWRYVMDTPVALDLNAEEINAATVTITVGGANANQALEWRNNVGNNRKFRIVIGGLDKIVTPRFGTHVPAPALNPVMSDVALALENALNDAAAFGPGACRVIWDDIYTRFIIFSQTYSPITEVSARDITQNNSLFDADNLNAHFDTVGDINAFREIPVLAVDVAGASATDPESWRALGSDPGVYSFGMTVGSRTLDIVPNFVNIPLANAGMTDVAAMIEAAVRNGFVNNNIVVVWDEANSRFLFMSCDNSVVTLQAPATPAHTSLFGYIGLLADAHFGNVHAGMKGQVIEVSAGQTAPGDVTNAANWKALNNIDIPASGGRKYDITFYVTIGGVTKKIVMNTALSAVPALNPKMSDVAHAFETAINHGNVFGAEAVSVFWNGNQREFVFMSNKLSPLMSVEGGNTGDNEKLIFDESLNVRFEDIYSYGQKYNREYTVVLKPVANNPAHARTPANWAALAGTKSFRITLGEVSAFISPDFTGSPTMNDVAGRIEQAVNALFGNNSVVVRWDSVNSYFVLTSMNNVTVREVSGRDVPAAGSLFTANAGDGLRISEALIVNDFQMLEKVVSTTAQGAANKVTSIMVSTDDVPKWRALGNTRSFSVTVDGRPVVVTPDFSGIGAAGTMQDVANVLQNTINARVAGNPVVVTYNATFKRMVVTSVTPGISYSGVAEFDAPGVNTGSNPSLVEKGSPVFIAGYITGIPGDTVTLKAGSSHFEAWKGLGNRHSFSMTVKGQTSNTTKTFTVTPDFRYVDNMKEVCSAIADAINAQATNWHGAPVDDFSVKFDETTLAFTIKSDFFRQANDKVIITSISAPSGSKPSLIGTSAGAFLMAGTTRQPEKFTVIHSGKQGGKHFSIASDPTDSNFLYVGGDRQAVLYKPSSLKHNQAEVSEWVGILFRVNTAETAPASGILAVPANAQDQLTGKGSSVPAGSVQGNVWDVPTAPHADSRCITLMNNGNILLEADDGGIFMLGNPTNNPANGARYWQSLNGNLSITEFNSIAYDPYADIIFGGTQDVGNLTQSENDPASWETVTLGDGNVNLLGEDKANGRVYGYSVGNTLHTIKRVTLDQDGNETARRDISIELNNFDREQEAFDSIAGSVSPVNGQRLALAYGGIYESSDNGDSWNLVFDLIRQDTSAQRTINDSAASVIAYSTTVERDLYVGNKSGQFFVINTQTQAVRNISRPLDGSMVIDIVVDPDNGNTVYALGSGNIAVTRDAGATWYYITNEDSFSKGTELVSIEMVNTGKGDLKMTDRNGNSVTVVLAGAETIGNVRDIIINAAHFVNWDLQVAIAGGRLVLVTLTPNPADPADRHDFKIEAVNGSTAAADLGIFKTATVVQPDTITGDVIPNLVDQNTLLTALRGGAGIGIKGLDIDLLIAGTDKGVYYSIDPIGQIHTETKATVDIANTLRITAKKTGAYYNGVTVVFLDSGGAQPSVSWDPAAHELEFYITNNVTLAQSVADLLDPGDPDFDPVAGKYFSAEVLNNNPLNLNMSGELEGGFDLVPGWIQMGKGLPDVRVVNISYTGRIVDNNNNIRGDVLVAATLGRGAWKVKDLLMRELYKRPVVSIDLNSDDPELLSLVNNDNMHSEIDVYYDHVFYRRVPASGTWKLVVRSDEANKTLQIDSGIKIPGSIVFVTVDQAPPDNRIEFYGTGINSVIKSIPAGKNSGDYLITQTGSTSLYVEVVNLFDAWWNFTVDNMSNFKAGLKALSNMDQVNNALGRDAIPLVGRSLSSAVSGSPPQAPLPIGFPARVSASQQALISGLAAQGLTMKDLEGDDSIIGRFLNSGPLGDFVSEIGDAIGDYDALCAILDGLDDIADNVTYTEEGSNVTFDMSLDKTFAGEGEIDIDAFDGKLSLGGDVFYSFDILLHLIFGVDEKGFFIDTETLTEPELKVSNLNLVGTVEAIGNIGFIQVTLTDGTVTVNEAVSISVDFHDPTEDDLNGEAPGLLRLHELNSNSVFDLFSLVIQGNPAADDLIFTGYFGVGLALPGLSSVPFTIAEAGLKFSWNDISDPFNVLVEGLPGSETGQLLAEFLNLDFQQYLLDLLAGVEDVADSINGLTPLDTELPLVNTSINGLFVKEPYRIGDLLKLYGPVKGYFDKLEAEGGFPKIDEFLKILIDSTAEKMEGSALGASLNFNEGNPELSFGLGVSIDPEFMFSFDLGTALQNIGLGVTASASVRVKTEFRVYATFGLELQKIIDKSHSIGDSVFFELNDVSAAVELTVYDIDLDMDFGFVQAALEDAGFSLFAKVRLYLDDPDGRVTLTELKANSFSDLFSVKVEDIEVQLAISSGEAFVGTGRDVDRGHEGTGVLVTVENLGCVVYGHFPVDEATGELQSPVWSYAVTGGGEGQLLGIDGVTMDASMSVKMNTTGRAVEETIETGGEPVEITFEEDQGDVKFLEIKGKVAVYDYCYLGGTFTLTKGQRDVTLSDGTSLTVDLLTVGANDAYAFAGVNGPPTEEGAMGLALDEVSVALAMMSVPAPEDPEVERTDLRNWTALKASVGSARFIGVEGMTIAVDDFYVAANKGAGTQDGNENQTVVDFSADELVVDTGEGTSETIDFGTEMLTAEGTFTLSVYGFFYIAGWFSFKTSTETVTLSDGEPLPAELLTLSASGVDVFAGLNGPADSPSAVGFVMEDVSFAIVLIKPAPPGDPDAEQTDLRSWTAVAAEAGNVYFAGLEDVSLTIEEFRFFINKGGGEKDGEANTTVVDFFASPLTIETGEGGSLTLDFQKEFLGVEATVTLGVFDFFYVHGSFAFEKTETEVVLSDASWLEADVLTVGAQVDEAFAGVNGPADNPGAMGFALEAVDFGLALITPKAPDDLNAPRVDKRSWTALKANVGKATLVGIDGVTVDVEDFGVALNKARGTNGGIQNTAVIDFSGNPLELNTGGGNSLTLDFKTELLHVEGTLTLGVYEFFFAHGSFAFVKKSASVTLNDDSQVDVELFTVGASDVSAFAGVNGPADNPGAMGFVLEDVAFALALMKKKADPGAPEDTRGWTALEAKVGSARIIGIEDITVSVTDFSVAINQGSGKDNAGQDNNTVVDFAETSLEVNTGGGRSILFDFVDELLQAEGSVVLSVYSFFFVSGSFAFQKRNARVGLSDRSPPDDDMVDVELLTAGASGVDAFAGVNGPASEPGAMGLTMTNANFALALIKPKAPEDPALQTDLRSWIAVRAYVGKTEFIGVDDLTVSVADLYVSVNKGSGTQDGEPNDTVVDFTQSDFDLDGEVDGVLSVTTGPESTMDIDFVREFLQAEGSVDIDLYGFFQVSETFAFEKSSGTVALNDGSHVAVELLTLGASNVNAFAGINGPEGEPGAMGLSLEGINFALALMKTKAPADPDTEQTDVRSWVALKAEVTDADFIGVEGLTVSVDNLLVAVNQGSGRKSGAVNRTVVDFTQSDFNGDGDPEGFLRVNTGEGNDIDIDFTKKFLQVEGTLDLGVYDFFYVNGHFAFEKSGTIVTLSDGSSVEVGLLTIGASNVNAFAGVNGPPENPGAMGLSLSGVGLALALMKTKAPAAPEVQTDLRSWTALKASVGGAQFVGIDGLTIQVEDFHVAINKGSGTQNGQDNTTVVDFTGEPLTVNVGGDNYIELDFEKELLTIEGTVELGIFEFFHTSGNFAFEKTEATVVLSDGSEAEVVLLTVGASNVSAFAGVNGPADSPGAMGLVLSDAEFALALMKPKAPQDPATQTDLRTWTSLEANVGSAQFIGVEDVTLSVTDVHAAVNKGGGTLDSQPNTTVVDFSQYDANGDGEPEGYMSINTGPGSSLDLVLTKEFLQVEATVEIDLFGFVYTSGNFAFEKSNASVTLNDVAGSAVEVEILTVGASNLQAFAGLNGPADNPGALGLSLTGVDFALALMKVKTSTPSEPPDTRSWTALKATVTEATFVGVDDVTATVQNLEVFLNKGSSADTAVIDFTKSGFDADGNGTPDGFLRVNTGGGNSLDLDFTQELLHVAGSLILEVAGQSLTGNFVFERTTNAEDGEIILVGVSNVQSSFLSGASPMISLTNVSGFMVINTTGMAGELELEASFNTDVVTVSGSLSLAVNNSSEPISEEIVVGGETRILEMPAGPYVRVAGNDLDLNFADKVTMQGSFQFEQMTRGTEKAVRVAAVDVFAEVAGRGKITEGYGGFIFKENGAAGIMKGDIELDIVLTGEGEASFQMNTTGGPVQEVITVNRQEIRIEFVTPDKYDFVDFLLTKVTFQFGDYVRLTGDYRISQLDVGKPQERSLIGAKNVDVFLGEGPYELPDGAVNPDAVGVLVKGARLGVVLFADDTFALVAEGPVALVGVDGLTIEGTITARVNNSGRGVDEVIDITGDDPIEVIFGSGQNSEAFKGDLTFSVADLFTLTGSVVFTRLPDGSLQVDIPVVSLVITVEGEETVGISGAASFSLGGGQGFKLQNLRVNGFSLFGESVGVTPGANARDFPGARLARPVSFGLIDRADLNDPEKKYMDVVFTDPGGAGLDEASIMDSGLEFELAGPAARNVVLNGSPEHVLGNTYRYSFEGDFIEGEVQVKFLGQTWSDTSGNNNLAFTERFIVVSGPRAPPPAAQLTNPRNGDAVDVKLLNARRYIDITFIDRSAIGLNESTILDQAPEFTLSGSGVADLSLGPSGELLGPGGNPIVPTHLYGTTYRYLLTDKDPGNDVGVFSNGEVMVSYLAGAWSDNAGVLNQAVSEKFTVRAATSSSGSTSRTISLGPLVLQGPSIGLTDFSFKNKVLNITVAIGVDSATLNFGKKKGSQPSDQQSQSGITATLTGVLGTFDLTVNVMALLGGGDGSFVSVPGRFSFSISQFEIEIPNLLKAGGTGIKISYDPAYDPAEHNGVSQALLVVQSAFVTFPRLNVTGSIKPYDPPGGGATIPGLTVREDGFSLGTAELCYGCGDNSLSTSKPGAAVKLGSILEFDDLRIGVSNLEVTFGQAVDFDGEIYIASGGARFFPGKKISATISDRQVGEPAGNTEAVRATLTFSDGKVDDFRFEVDTLSVDLGKYLTLKAQGVKINTGAGDDEEVVSFISIGAQVRIGSFIVGGEARNFAFLGDGSFKAKKGFAVILNMGSTSGENVGWPNWMPIQITTLGLEFEDIENRPEDFIITLSANVTSLHGMKGLEFSGSIEGVKISPNLLAQGKFPIIDIASIGVTVRGKMFGGKINAALIGGILKIDAGYNIIHPTDTTTEVVERIFFMGLEGGFEFPGVGGITIRFALSELGPLGVFLSASVPGGIVLEPNTGLAMNDFSAGVEFFKTLPSLTDPYALRQSAFMAPTAMSAQDWLFNVKYQVVQQYRAIQEGSAKSGFAAAFTSPMLITGSAKIFTIYTSKEVFNGEVMIKFSTDGKFLIAGKLNYANDKISISGKLYADLTKVEEGDVTVLFLADYPDQLRLLTIHGKLKMGFKNADGEEVAFDVLETEEISTEEEKPTGDIVDPADGGSMDVVVLNDRVDEGSRYIDVVFQPGKGKTLDYATILDGEEEFELTVAGNPVSVNGAPTPLSLETDENGLLVMRKVTQESEESDDAYYSRLSALGITNFRYAIDDPTFEYSPGEVAVDFTAGAL
ncbi:MAG: hypothetical protein AMJ79_03720, partial [Phycisphaerae bacterium SM23_30]